MSPDPADSSAWTGLPRDPALRPHPLNRAASARQKLIAIGCLFGGVMVAFGINGIHVTSQTGPAEVSWVRFIPAHWGNKTWVPDTWDVHISLQREDADLVLNQAPPEWLTIHKPLRVTYGHGRLYTNIILQDVSPGGSSALIKDPP